MNGGYIPIEETADSEKKRGYWQAAIGLQRIDGLKPSELLLELAEQNIAGKRRYDAVKTALTDYYADKDLTSQTIADEYEADLVSLRITKLLDMAVFQFSVDMLKVIHRELFDGLPGINDYAGAFRDFDITKPEPILYGNSVYYSGTKFIDYSFEQAFAKEQAHINGYSSPLTPASLESLARFSADIWYVHAFVDGNTRTTAVFIELYLRWLGFEVDNSQFDTYAEYYRDALVRASYIYPRLGIRQDTSFLERFYENLLLNTNHRLEDLDLAVHELQRRPTTVDHASS